MRSYSSANPSETRALGQRLAEKLRPGHLILLHGDLGAGKTCFTQGIAAGLGVDGPVQSPTFILIAEYPAARVPLRHVDLYRLERTEEILALGLEERLDDGVWVVEWAERFADSWPADRLEVELQEEGEGRRLIFRATGADHRELEDV
ncbi:MAG TPA: tRNA (adenosine(37)-N6)-threonylcarbamoyltransferase complex ATPase subunit type 1 TsaE [Myxococcota bacterium]|nr:tRNA (adenosine(37)-N6)-threonylcarbamoyltransferase complex ATPase subunit type 1 TsaE [Myxococcota bacterium]HNH47745.1 tRNA (adenosine(37)-N6)-threonylcarbamoyltransferase complex ATPase subunit type 1 TsaE [Myxococcota bacterium]